MERCFFYDIYREMFLFRLDVEAVSTSDQTCGDTVWRNAAWG